MKLHSIDEILADVRAVRMVVIMVAAFMPASLVLMVMAM